MLEHSRHRVDGSVVHVVEGGPRSAPAILFLHGWPQCWAEFERVMQLLAPDAHVVAIDLPGIGGSTTPARSQDKRTLAGCVQRAITALDLQDLTLVGHDVGGMIVYAHLRAYPGVLARAAILSVVIPGIEPWRQVYGDPAVWHFHFHAVRDLPERLIQGRERSYFDYFFDAIAARPDAVPATARDAYAAAYRDPVALRTGFDWYRAFEQDAADNAASFGQRVTTPVLYLRGTRERGDIADYVRELRSAGLDALGESIADSGHFVADEQPDALAAALRRFALAR